MIMNLSYQIKERLEKERQLLNHCLIRQLQVFVEQERNDFSSEDFRKLYWQKRFQMGLPASDLLKAAWNF
jgi:hypothetical protein